MTSLSSKSKERIRETIEFLRVNQRAITVQIEGEETPFVSKIVKADHGDILSSGTGERLVIGYLSPGKGRDLIQSKIPFRVRFSLGKSQCEFTSSYVTESVESPHFGHMITYPNALLIVDRRGDSRSAKGTDQPPLFVHARVKMSPGGSQLQSYDLRVFDVSEKGVGVLVGQELAHLLDGIGIGDRVELELYAPWTMVKSDGTVRHKSRMREGLYSGYHLLGIELAERLEF